MKNKIIFDAYAVLELLEDGAGAQKVADILSDSEATVYLSTINLGEVYYIVLRRKGEFAAENVLENIFLEESLELVEATWPRIKAAAALKARGGLSYADCFVLALAAEEKAPLVTSDLEIIRQAKKEGLEVIEL